MIEPKTHSLRQLFTRNFKLSIAILLMWITVVAPVVADSFHVNNIRVAKNGEVTRVVFDTSAIPSYKLFTLNNPARLVIDMQDAKLSTKVNQAVFNSSFVDQLRYAHRNNKKLRIVLDLNQKIIPKSFILAPNENAQHRLVIDLKNASRNTTQIAKAKSSKAVNNAKGNTTSITSKNVKSISKTTSKNTAKPAANKVEKSKDIIAQITAPKTKSNKTVAALNKNKAPKPSTTIKPRNKTITIAIDPGHGGKDPGAIGYAGTYEKDVVLKISKRLARLINAEPGMRAIMTRDTDVYLTLRSRIRKARQQKADVFISVHADAVHDRRVRGSSVYILSENGASSEAARLLAQKHNESEVIGGVNLQGKGKDVQKVLVDLSQAATIDASMKLATSVKNELSRLGKTRKHVEHAGFAVLKSPDIPSVLVETAFISNPTEEKKLRSSTHQQKLAVSIFKGVKSYLKHHAPRDAIIASNKINSKPHTIKYGETLSGIAVRYSVSVDSIRRTNSLTNDSIRVGQKLIIPGV